MASSEWTQVSISVPNELLVDFDLIAVALECDRSWIILRALKAFLEGDDSVILNESEDLAQLDRGESYDLDDVLAQAEAIIVAGGMTNADPPDDAQP
jgi:predicted transcriptional regulator